MRHLLLIALIAGLVAVVALPDLSSARPATSLAQRYTTTLAQIAAARQSDPRAFQSVARLRARMPELDRRKRGRLVPVMPLLRSLGPRALLPMLGELTAATPETLGGGARLAWRIGLLEATGALRDPRATPVLRRLLATESEPSIVRAAAGALGDLGDQEAVDVLTALSATPGPRRLPVIAGMGRCRRLPAARALAQALAQRPREELAATLAKALGELGSAWAWETPRLTALNEGAAVRAVAAGALVDAFVRYGGAVQRAAETAILVVDAPQTLALIAKAGAVASPALQAELARLAARVERSPLRPRKG
jgi:HEAT repeat protein